MYIYELDWCIYEYVSREWNISPTSALTLDSISKVSTGVCWMIAVVREFLAVVAQKRRRYVVSLTTVSVYWVFEQRILDCELTVEVLQVEILLLCGWLLLEVVSRVSEWLADVAFFCMMAGGYRALEDMEALDDEDLAWYAVEARIAGIGSSVERAWAHYFEDPTKYWDKRRTWSNPRVPDSKNKRTRQALWINSYYTLDWVKKRFRMIQQWHQHLFCHNGKLAEGKWLS